MPRSGGDLPGSPDLSSHLKVDWTGTAADRCAWCETPFDGSTIRRTGRTFCGHCGSATTDPLPDPESLDAAYGDWYWPGTGKRFGLVGDALLRRSRAAMAGRIDEVAPPGPVLDVGAGEGTLIDALRELGREASGLEKFPKRDDLVDLPLTEVERKDFAAIVFWHSLEHLPDSGEVMKAASERLRPGGVVFVAVPDVGSPQARFFGDSWLHLDLPRHLVHLTTDSLSRIMEADGLTVIDTSRTRAGQNLIGWLDGLVAMLPGGLNLYQALRRKQARRIHLSPVQRVASILAAIILSPVALVCAAFEIVTGRSGTIYAEGRLG